MQGCERERERDIYTLSDRRPKTTQHEHADRKKKRGKLVEDYSKNRAV